MMFNTVRLCPEHVILKASLRSTRGCLGQQRPSTSQVPSPYRLRRNQLTSSARASRSCNPHNRPLLFTKQDVGNRIPLIESIGIMRSSNVGGESSGISSHWSRQREKLTIQKLLQRGQFQSSHRREVQSGMATDERDFIGERDGANQHNFRFAVGDTLSSALVERIPSLSLEEIGLLTQDSSILVTEAIVAEIFRHLISQLGHTDTIAGFQQILSSFVGLVRSPFFTHLKGSHSDFDSKIVSTFNTVQGDISPGKMPTIILELGKLRTGVLQLDPLPVVCQEIFRDLDLCSEETLGTLAEFLNISRLKIGPYASLLLVVFQRRIQEIESPQVFAKLSLSVVSLISLQFQGIVFRRFKELLQSPNSFPIDSLGNMMQASLSFDSPMREDILESCSMLLLPQVGNMTIPNIVKYLEIFQESNSRKDATFTAVMKRLEENVSHLTSRKEVVVVADVLLSRLWVDDSSHLGVMQKMLDALDQNGSEELYLSRICAIALRLRDQNPELLSVVKRKCLELLPGISDVWVLNSLSRFVKVVGAPRASRVLLKDKLTQAAYTAFTPRGLTCVITGLGKLGLNPSEIDPFLWLQVKKFLPRLTGESFRYVLRMLGQSRYFHVSPVDHPELCSLQVEVFAKLLGKRPPRHLHLETSVTPETKQGCSAGQLGNGTVSINNVVGVSQYLYLTGYYFQDTVDQISEITRENLENFSTYELKDIMQVLACCGATHPHVEEICRDFAERLSFVEMWGPFFVLEGALLLAQLQAFHRKVLERVFNWRFLETFECLKPNPRFSNLLMEVNRAVCLECPELNVPWFHHEVDPKDAFNRGKWTGRKEAVHEALNEVLGNEQHIETRGRTPYNYHADFVFEYDSAQQPSTSPVVLHSEKVAMDVLPRSAYFRHKGTRLKGVYSMKKRHLEMLGYRYVHIPEHEWRRRFLPFRSDKVEYLLRKLSGESTTSDNTITSTDRGVDQ